MTAGGSGITGSIWAGSLIIEFCLLLYSLASALQVSQVFPENCQIVFPLGRVSI
jgi:hypothetical protein